MSQQSQQSKATHDASTRAEAIRLVRQEKMPVSRAAKVVGVNRTTIHRWLGSADGASAEPAPHKPHAPADACEGCRRAQAEIRALKERTRVLTLALGYVAGGGA